MGGGFIERNPSGLFVHIPYNGHFIELPSCIGSMLIHRLHDVIFRTKIELLKKTVDRPDESRYIIGMGYIRVAY